MAAAYRVGELPDYMLEFVDSLERRRNQPFPEPPGYLSGLMEPQMGGG